MFLVVPVIPSCGNPKGNTVNENQNEKTEPVEVEKTALPEADSPPSEAPATVVAPEEPVELDHAEYDADVLDVAKLTPDYEAEETDEPDEVVEDDEQDAEVEL